MVVNNLDVRSAILSPNKADSPLPVDADAVLPLSIILQRFEPVSWRDLQVVEDQTEYKFQLIKGEQPNAMKCLTRREVRVEGLDATLCNDYLLATASRAFGFVRAMVRRVLAAPLGCFLPCSQP